MNGLLIYEGKVNFFNFLKDLSAHITMSFASLCVVCFLVMCVAASGCTHALPAKAPLKEVAEYVERAEQAEAQARSYAEQARREMERSEMLIAEAKAQLARAEAAQVRCAELARKIPKLQKRQVIVVRPKEPEVSATGEVKKEGETAKAPEKKEETLPYSPSDAPIKK
jgi:hypothetical protein